MAFTADGNALAAHGLILQLLDAQLVVTDGGDQLARVPVDDTFPRRDGATITLRGTFGEGEANFEWRVRRVETADGKVVDEEAGDMGRKAAGAVWDLEIELEVGG